MNAMHLVSTRHFRFLLFASLVSSLALSGCSSEDEIRGRISGKVTSQGEPVPEGLVLFHCHDTGINMNATIKDGAYEVIRAKGAGLPLGDYWVRVCPPNVLFGGPESVKEFKEKYKNIPEKYRNFETSGLTVTIIDGDNPYDIAMEP